MRSFNRSARGERTHHNHATPHAARQPPSAHRISPGSCPPTCTDLPKLKQCCSHRPLLFVEHAFVPTQSVTHIAANSINRGRRQGPCSSAVSSANNPHDFLHSATATAQRSPRKGSSGGTAAAAHETRLSLVHRSRRQNERLCCGRQGQSQCEACRHRGSRRSHPTSPDHACEKLPRGKNRGRWETHPPCRS